MSTHDVPGANAANNDKLGVGSWGEHPDGSLILVEGLEGDSVVYSLFDVADEPVEFRDAMSEAGFKKTFGKPGRAPVAGVVWTWHDKTSFPWDRVMGEFPSGSRTPSARSTLSAAARVADALHLRAGKADLGKRGVSTALHQAADAIKDALASLDE